ncbi:MAG: hypothetical protein MZV63_24445 [Marinilabiliales bacterium]|nr:hypothetical protein [Marinilabiliales bacterium]
MKRCFNQRRKMIRNPAKMMIRPGCRINAITVPEAGASLSVDQFVELTSWADAHRQQQDP